MQEFVKKLIERLEGESYLTTNDDGETNKFSVQVVEWKDIKKIINQLAEEYNNGWISCSERLPEEYGEYLCINKYGVCILGYPRRNKADDDIVMVETENEILLECIAWKPITPYQPKGE